MPDFLPFCYSTLSWWNCFLNDIKTCLDEYLSRNYDWALAPDVNNIFCNNYYLMWLSWKRSIDCSVYHVNYLLRDIYFKLKTLDALDLFLGQWMNCDVKLNLNLNVKVYQGFEKKPNLLSPCCICSWVCQDRGESKKRRGKTKTRAACQWTAAKKQW